MSDLEQTQNLPYQAYKSKRHSRVHSNGEFVLASSTITPAQSPLSTPAPLTPSSPLRPPTASSPPVSNTFSTSPLQEGRSSSLGQLEVQPQIIIPASPVRKPGSIPPPSQPEASSPLYNNAEGQTSARTGSKKASTFRRVPLSKPTPHPSSPLGPNRPTPSHSRVTSISSVPQLPLNGTQSSFDSPATVPSPQTFQSSQSNIRGSPTSRQSTPLPNATFHNPSPSTISMRSPVDTSSSPSSSPTVFTKPSAGRPSDGPPPFTKPTRSSAPYRPGFQPKGVYRPLTDSFIALRRLKRDGDGKKRVERTKLERRLEKLITLHFPNLSSVETEKLATNDHKAIGEPVKRTPSILNLDFKNVKFSDPTELWKNVIYAVESGGGVDIRAEEQRITPWVDDSIASKCPLCSASFHPLTNRKHHCRLCGKLVCSLPIKHPQRPVTCSLLFVVDPRTRKVEEVGEGVDYGVRKKRTPSVSTNSNYNLEEDEERFLKGVRICRECKPVLLRRQYLQEMMCVPSFVRLYETFATLENDIEGKLPEFQELVLTLSKGDSPSKDALLARKRLLESFAHYDNLAKQIQSLPCPKGPASSQARVQLAISARASLFLQKNMLPLQALPTSLSSKNTTSNASSTDLNNSEPDPYSEIAHILQPLLEQEALLETYVEEASAQRKFEDVKALKINLAEIRREIYRMVQAVDTNQGPGANRMGT